MASVGCRAPDLKLALDSIEVDPSRPRASYLRRAVKTICEAWTLRSNIRSTSNSISQSTGHVFVLTSNPFALDRVLSSSKYQTHVICASPVPWSLPQRHSHNGWSLVNRSLPSARPPSLSRRCEDNFYAQLRLLVSNARVACLPDHLTNVRLSITSAPDSAIEGILGSTCFASLGAGELRTVLVKVRPTRAPASPALLSRFPQGLRTPSGNVDIERELDAALSDAPFPAFSIQLRYGHTALPAGTICEITRDVLLRTSKQPQETLSASFASTSDLVTEDSARAHHVVQARLAFHLAMSQNPRRGIAAVRSQFVTSRTGSVVSEYVHAILEELKHQARVLERLDAYSAQTGSQAYLHSPVASACNPYDGMIRRLDDSQLTLSGLDVEDVFPSPPPPLRPRRKDADDSNDQARQIWQALRIRKSPNRQPRFDHEVGKEPSTETLREIKQTAERNRRSLGQDTLKSLRYEKMQENVAPWL